jgi:hypothetical protein
MAESARQKLAYVYFEDDCDEDDCDEEDDDLRINHSPSNDSRLIFNRWLDPNFD